ncbi:1,4-alpha-glucan branching enzyme GlgB [compost metagenome]
MPGNDAWQRFANLRVLYMFTMGHPGKKLTFMGNEFGQMDDWDWDGSLEWDLLSYEEHGQFAHFVTQMNHFYMAKKALWKQDYKPTGYEWIETEDQSDGLVTFYRKSGDEDNEQLVIVCNFRSVAHEGYRLGISMPGRYREVFNSDNPEFGGSGVSNEGELNTEEWFCQNRPNSMVVNIPPLAAVIFEYIPSEG